ncbi:MAG: aminotransferase class I/II-fold pyridoxal phosphate-dependent enzyme [Planctomycetes bacterium]|nr:aminotransferase class I/II-fold pyridoxal phosphate-dependent enzyme [Planctomycetota bacterium]
MTARPFGTSDRLRPFGESVFATISRLAARYGAVNLGQGFPNFDGPEFVKDAAIRAIREGRGQYARTFGLPEVTRAVAARFRATSGVEVDPDAEVTVTSGCTEASAAVMLGLVNPGDEVVLVEPFYDSYPACVAMAGGTVRTVRLRAPDFAFPLEDLRKAVGPRTKAILVNTPHNPLGRVLTRAELEGIAAIARAADCLVISDEVYEEIWYGEPHLSISTLPGMRERTVVLSSLGKTFSLTGWKIGWSIAPPALSAGVRAAHQFLTFCSATPLQRASVDALSAPRAYYEGLRADYRARRDLLLAELRGAGLDPYEPEGSYFVVAPHAGFGFAGDVEFVMHLVEKVGVACIPCSAFHMPGPDGCKDAEARSLVRFAFCKTPETLRAAGERLRSMGRVGRS